MPPVLVLSMVCKNSFHVVDLDLRGAIVLRQKWTRVQVAIRLATMPPYLIGKPWRVIGGCA